MEGTRAGLILGTAAYMSPEQARGKVVDKRADIWAFGVVLYEMLTGHRPFRGETLSDTLSAVLAKEPEWDRVPASVERLLTTCLAKEPKRRLRDIGDAWQLLEDAPVPAPTTSLRWKVAAGVSLAAFVIALWAPWRDTARPIEQSSSRLDLDLGPNISLGSSTGPAVILSPDGKRLIFASQGADGQSRLFRRQLDEPGTVEMPGTEGASAPFFSPDGQWVGFFARGKLKKTLIDGGQPLSLCDAPSGRGGSWSENGEIVANLDPAKGLWLVSPEGGKAVPLTELGPGEQTHRWPQVLPGSKTVLFSLGQEVGNFDTAGIAVVDLKGKGKKVVIEHAGMYPRYLPSGHLGYVTKGKIFVVPFDIDRFETRGAPVAFDDVSSNTSIGSAQFDFSRNGILAYRSGRTEDIKTIQWLDAEGKTTPLWNEAGAFLTPRLSPDGTRLVLQVDQESGADLWIYDWQRSTRTRLTNGIVASMPIWTPDGRFVVFRSVTGISWLRAENAGNPEPLTQSPMLQVPVVFTPDGTRLVYSQVTHGSGAEMRTLVVESASGGLRAGKSELFAKLSSNNLYAAFSPDGRWLAYMDSPDGVYEVYVRAFPDNGTRVQISNSGGNMPVWSRNGHELFYKTEDQRIMVCNYVVKGQTFLAEKPRLWAAKRLANVGMANSVDLAPDGKRFAVLMPVESPEPRESDSHAKLLFNFPDEIRRRVAGVGK
jgi:serine/threonine-protein kinase